MPVAETFREGRINARAHASRVQAEGLAVLTVALEQNREEYSKRLDLLAGQIAEEARRRAEAEAQALTYYRAHTQTQAKSQVRRQPFRVAECAFLEDMPGNAVVLRGEKKETRKLRSQRAGAERVAAAEDI